MKFLSTYQGKRIVKMHSVIANEKKKSHQQVFLIRFSQLQLHFWQGFTHSESIVEIPEQFVKFVQS